MGPPFYVVIRAKWWSSRLQGKAQPRSQDSLLPALRREPWERGWAKRLRQIVQRDQVSPLLVINCSLWLVVARNFLSIKIINCLELFYLLIFVFEKFSTWIWRLPFAVYVKLKLLSFLSYFNTSVSSLVASAFSRKSVGPWHTPKYPSACLKKPGALGT